jgi:c-di-GMP-binding flagellar brake protein YcgR
MSLEDIRLNPGAEIHIQIMEEGLHTRYKVHFIGFIKNNSVLVTLPFDHDQGIWMHAGQSFVLRGFNGIYAYAFSAQVIRARAHPFPYIHFSWPHDVICQLVRKSRRVAVEILAVWLDHRSESVTILDLSVQGTMLDSALALAGIGEQARIMFTVVVDETVKDLDIAIIVRNIQKKENGNGFRIGVVFLNVTKEQVMTLHYYVNNIALSA